MNKKDFHGSSVAQDGLVKLHQALEAVKYLHHNTVVDKQQSGGIRLRKFEGGS